MGKTKASGTNKEIYHKEIEEAYNIAVKNAISQNELKDNDKNTVCDKIYGVEKEWQKLNKKRLGFDRPDYKLLSFIRQYAGEEYDYTFLAPKKGHTIISKFMIDHNLIVKMSRGGGIPIGQLDENSYKTFLLFCFLGLKQKGYINKNKSFYSFLKLAVSQDEVVNRLQDISKSKYLLLFKENIKMLEILPNSACFYAQCLHEDKPINKAILDFITQFLPNLEKIEQFEQLQCFIRMRDHIFISSEPNFEDITEVEFESEELDLEGEDSYKRIFISRIISITKDEWNTLIKLVTLHQLNEHLYDKVIQLISQSLSIYEDAIKLKEIIIV